MSRIPEWMSPNTAEATPIAHLHRRRSFARSAAGAFARLMEHMIDNESIASRPGLLQSIDARAKLIGLLSLLVIVTLIQSTWVLSACYVLCIALAVLSRVPASRLLRVWIAVPLFSAAVVLPAALNIVTEGRHILTIAHFPGGRFGPWQMPADIAITDAGLLVALRFILRTAVCVSLAMFLTITTRTARLFKGMRALGVPQLFVMVLSMMERYLGVLARSAEEVHIAKISRSIACGNTRQEQAWVAAGVGSVFRRTQALGSQVYSAMLSRGYTGEVYLLDSPRMRKRDWTFLLITAALDAALVLWLRK